jgi:enoyl-CoA hydratase/carnithine racemase
MHAQALNSMPRAMHAELSKVFRYFDDHLTLGVAIVTGKGKVPHTTLLLLF